jgi:regulator of sirC expression with transglutaminase-like and TPR domain
MTDPIFVHPAAARREFAEFAAGEITNENLAHGALLIALEDYPQLDVWAYLRELDALADRVLRRCVPGEPAIFRLGHLHAEIFDSDGYRGNSESYYDPRNAYLNEVIDRKLGIPITLSIIFLHVASRIGLNAFGVGLPAHYIVKVQFALNEVYVDPFYGGTTLTLAEIAELVSTASSQAVRLTSEHLRAWGGRETLARVLANLQNMWANAGDARKAQGARERLAILQRGGTPAES